MPQDNDRTSGETETDHRLIGDSAATDALGEAHGAAPLTLNTDSLRDAWRRGLAPDPE